MTKEQVSKMVAAMCLAKMDEMEYGDFSIRVTMHEGLPVKITESKEIKLMRLKDRNVEVQK